MPVVGGAGPYRKVDLYMARWRAEADDWVGGAVGLLLGYWGFCSEDLPKERPRLREVGRGIL